MVANQFFDSLNKFQCNTYVGVDDFADKLNFLFTIILLLICVSVVTVRQYILKPISCYLSTDIGGVNLLEYVENYCWVHGTIPMSYNGSIPSTETEWQEMEEFKILYYQWVPFVISLQCIFFHFPRLMWTIICRNQSGTDIQHIITSANQAVHSSEEAKEKMTIYIAKNIEQMLFHNQSEHIGIRKSFNRYIYNNCAFCIASKRLGCCVVMGYFSIKLLYIGNAFGQLYFMKHFLGFESFSFFGLKVLSNLMTGKDWEVTLIFPRVTLCYAKIRHLGAKSNGVTAQCVLPVNMLNEKIYIFLWHWILFCGFISFISLLHWIYKIGKMKYNSTFIRTFLLLNEKIKRYDTNHKNLVEKFTKNFLKYDGIFLLRMMASNVGDIVTGEVVCHLWLIFSQKYQYCNLPKLNYESNSGRDCSPSLRLHLVSDQSNISSGLISSNKPSSSRDINQSQNIHSSIV